MDSSEAFQSAGRSIVYSRSRRRADHAFVALSLLMILQLEIVEVVTDIRSGWWPQQP